jgi:NADH:ubiquinone oxidoreductase subunit 3 (subunit A)
LNRERWFEIAAMFSVAPAHQKARDTLCTRCQALLSVAGATISLMTDEHMTSLCVSDAPMTALEDLQFTVGEGPTIEAFETGNPALEPQLRTALADRWPRLAGLLVDFDVEGVFAFPLRVGAARIGVLTLYQRFPAGLSPAQRADAFIAADVLAHVILAIEAKTQPETLDAAFQEAASLRAETHQASGMVSEQLHVDVAAALVLLRSRAYATDSPIAELSVAIIDGRIRAERTSDLEIEWSTEA